MNLDGSFDHEVFAAAIGFSDAVLGIVCVALVIVSAALVSLHRKVEAMRVPVVPRGRQVEPPSLATAANGDIPLEIVAVIAAAVHVTLGARHRIVAVERLNETNVWSLEGRRQVFQSHQVR